MRKNYFLLLICGILLILTSCERHTDTTVANPAPSVYFWRTVFKLDSTEQLFLHQHAIRKIYMRFFDVVKNDKGEIVPKSTIQFESPIPKGIAVIPVVYVENDCLQEPNDLSERIINRVYTMAQTHDISINEIQVDCDWTKSTMHDCFLLLNNMRLQLKSINNCKLSATIRMHQLAMPAPPVDYGVLMCYNTGDLHDYHTDNAILSEKDIRPYLNCLKKYELPICGAYPVFGWKLLFEGGQFRAILRSVDLSDAALYKKISDRKYLVIRSHSLPSPDAESFGIMLRAGDEIKVEEVNFQTIRNAQSLLEKKRPSINRQTIIYSLNTTDIQKLTTNEMDQIYRH